MKNKYIALMCFLFLSSIKINAQNAPHWCASHHEFESQMKTNPDYAHSQKQLEEFTARFVEDYLKSNDNQKFVNKVIPVVFHVVHEGGAENIDRSQILNQLEILNNDYQRLNADTGNTPLVFRPLAANSNIEFRLATLDPNGNCTDGITRTFSGITNGCRNNVKALIYWPSNKYLNVWVVKSIQNTGGSPGTVLGFAQFPGSGSSLTDGIVMIHSFVGAVGTAAGNGNNGRVLCHEAGHWFNLRHIWGDAVCGSDFVSDTPPQEALNFGCATWPSVSNCNGNAPNGDMFMNYMDYSDGDCMNMFSAGQSARMAAALNSGASGRNNLWTTANLAATGTDGSAPCNPVPVALINGEIKRLCAGGNAIFSSGSYNGAPFTYQWTFTGGNPSSSTLSNPTINYPTAGTYDVTLVATNPNGSNTITRTGMVKVYALASSNLPPFSQGFETLTLPDPDWYTFSDISQQWTVTSAAAKTGTKSLVLINNTTTLNGSDEFVTPAYNFIGASNIGLNFQVAFAQKNTAADNALKVYVSTNCGASWVPRLSKSGASLSTIPGTNSGNFVPTAAQWRLETVNLNNVANQPSVMFKFEFTNTGEANNIYLDDINIQGTVGLDDGLASEIDFFIAPNPADNFTTLNFTFIKKADATVTVYDMIGKSISEQNLSNLGAGSHIMEIGQNLNPGIYMVEFKVDNRKIVQRFIKQ
ncbi:MAG: T9SS type A sorting domain-containing protein [Bacteroidetes bacterium]|nr:T9SS type A sorting domain-containing protein [Bacteroidota bacterium]